MTECHNPEFKEQLPELAAEALDDATRDRVMQHVQACIACTEEHEILRAVHTTQMPVPYINVAKIVRALPPAPLPVRPELPWYRRASLQMAAAFLLVAGGLIAVRQAGDRVQERTAQVSVAQNQAAAAPEVASSQTPQATLASEVPAAPRSAVAPSARNDIALVAGLDEMTTDELSSLLKDVENLDAVPVAEPEQFSPVTALSENQGEG
jgi:hypothetical protein